MDSAHSLLLQARLFLFPWGLGGQDPDQLQLRAVLGSSRGPLIRLVTWPKTEGDYDFLRATDLRTTNQIRLIPRHKEGWRESSVYCFSWDNLSSWEEGRLGGGEVGREMQLRCILPPTITAPVRKPVHKSSPASSFLPNPGSSAPGSTKALHIICRRTRFSPGSRNSGVTSAGLTDGAVTHRVPKWSRAPTLWTAITPTSCLSSMLQTFAHGVDRGRTWPPSPDSRYSQRSLPGGWSPDSKDLSLLAIRSAPPSGTLQSFWGTEYWRIWTKKGVTIRWHHKSSVSRIQLNWLSCRQLIHQFYMVNWYSFLKWCNS